MIKNDIDTSRIEGVPDLVCQSLIRFLTHTMDNIAGEDDVITCAYVILEKVSNTEGNTLCHGMLGNGLVCKMLYGSKVDDLSL